MRVKVDWRSVSKENYDKFCKQNPNISLTFLEYKDIIYTFNENFREYILETGEKAKMPSGFGDFSIIKKKRKRVTIKDGVEYINLPIDWQKSREKGKRIYNFNYHTEGYFFGWYWFKRSARFKHSDLWFFKPFRTTSRLITEYINKDSLYQHVYREWNLKTD